MNRKEREIVDSLLMAYERVTPSIDQVLVRNVLTIIYPLKVSNV